MKKCPKCGSSNYRNGKCYYINCGFVERRKVHTMLAPGKERRGKKRSAWDNAPIWNERRW
jgi:hypothetical protein